VSHKLIFDIIVQLNDTVELRHCEAYTKVMSEKTYSPGFFVLLLQAVEACSLAVRLKQLDESEGGPMITAKIDAVIEELEETQTHRFEYADGFKKVSVHSPFKGRFGYGKLPVVVTVIEEEWQFGNIKPSFYQETDFIIEGTGLGEIKVHSTHEYMEFFKEDGLACEICPRCAFLGSWMLLRSWLAELGFEF
jgi:hypothetical protein